MKKLFLTAFAFLLWGVSSAHAQQVPVLEMYHGDGCPHCANQWRWLPTLEKMYPGLDIQDYEVWHNPENQARMIARVQEMGAQPGGVPTNIIGDEVIIGFNKAAILAAMADTYGPPTISEAEASQTNPLPWLITLGVIILGGIGWVLRGGTKKKDHPAQR